MILKTFKAKHGIHLAIFEWIRRKEPIVVTNFYIDGYEMDVMAMTKDHHLIEYEVKVSVNDFGIDFLKSHHEDGRRVMKHDLIKSGKRVNKFYFVVLPEMVGDIRVPDYAGLVVETDTGFKVLKKAPLLHDRTPSIDFYRDLCKGLSWREHTLRSKLRVANRMIEAKNVPQNG